MDNMQKVDPLAPAKGIIIGILLSLAIVAVLYAVKVLMFGW